MSAEQNFASLGLSLPPAPTPLGVYTPFLITGNYLYVSGHGPVRDDKSLIIGRIGKPIISDKSTTAKKVLFHNYDKI